MTLEGAECLRCSDARWQSVPGMRRSHEEHAVTSCHTTRRWCDSDKSEAKITNNRRVHSRYCIIEANYRQT